MTRRTRLLLGVLFAVALVGASLLIRNWLFEPVYEQRDVGLSGLAAVNPLLALEQMLEGAGIEATSARGFSHLPPGDHALLIAAPGRSLGEAGAKRLLAWAAGGGHLVIVAAPTGELRRDPLLEPLDIVPFHLPLTKEQLAKAARRGDSVEGVVTEDGKLEWEGTLALRHVGTVEPLRIDGSRGQATLIRLAHGAGLVTVLAEGAHLTNEEIGEGENALLAWEAMVPGPAPAGAWLIYRDRRPSPWSLLGGRAEPVVAALALLVLAWLWKLAARFGPLLPAAEPERRSLAEHVRAAGHWQWDCGAQRALIDAVRGSLRRRLGAGHDDDLTARALKAAADSGLDERRVAEALNERAPAERQDFARVVRTLDELRRRTR